MSVVPGEPIEQLVQRYRQGQRLALARLLTWAADPDLSLHVQAALTAIPESHRDSVVVAFTGNAGVGKSTLIGRVIELLRGRGKTVAVLACDPQSPLTGGALLGDRLRMSSRAADEGVFIRSVATGSGRQAIAENLELMTDLLVGFGFDVILLETVGAGQGDTAVRDAADVVVLLVQPETGDELQWEKAGVLEIADMIAVNKSDLPGAEQTESQLRSMLHLPGCRPTPIIPVSGRTNDGLEALWVAVEAVSRTVP
jgi:LAO/AO transport system ATPase